MNKIIGVLSHFLTALLVIGAMSLAVAAPATQVIILNGSAVVSTGNPLPVTGTFTPSATLDVEMVPTSAAGVATTPVVSASAESGHVLKSGAGNLYGFSATVGVTSGYVMLFNATSAPADGAVTPLFCYPVTSNGTNGGMGASWGDLPARFSTGITIVFSTTGCFTKTASATAFFAGQVQ